MLFEESVQFRKRDFQIFRLVVQIHVRCFGNDEQFFRFGSFLVCVFREIFRYRIFSHDEKYRTRRYGLDLREREEVHHRRKARVGVITRRVGMLPALRIVVIIEEIDGKLRRVLIYLFGQGREYPDVWLHRIPPCADDQSHRESPYAARKSACHPHPDGGHAPYRTY